MAGAVLVVATELSLRGCGDLCGPVPYQLVEDTQMGRRVRGVRRTAEGRRSGRREAATLGRVWLDLFHNRCTTRSHLLQNLSCLPIDAPSAEGATTG